VAKRCVAHIRKLTELLSIVVDAELGRAHLLGAWYVLRHTMRLEFSPSFSQKTLTFSSQASRKCGSYLQAHR
jgi:hypothetical protein